jgi:tetratricopeptide (TPR) repeat protein
MNIFLFDVICEVLFMKKKEWFGILIFFLCSMLMYAQQQNMRPYWFILEQGKFAFRNGDYGQALIAFEEAKRSRRSIYERMEQDIIEVLSVYEVRRMDNDLGKIEQYIVERYYVGAEAALAELYYRLPRDSLGNSAQKALEELSKFKDYPEAEYWIGETYRIEGEINIALMQYQKAYKQRALLEDAGFEVEILYKIIDIYKIQQNYLSMETRAREILALDTRFGNDSGIRTRRAMLQLLTNEGINRFLSVYRHNNFTVERAYRLLGLYYYAERQYDMATEYLMIDFLIQNTLLIEEMISTQYDFSFTTLDALFLSMGRRHDLFIYVDEMEYYKTMYYLGAALYGSGRLVSAQRFWTFLSRQTQAGEWSGRSWAQIRTPFIERVQIIP